MRGDEQLNFGQIWVEYHARMRLAFLDENHLR
jgi:hypothetical protein